MKINKIFISNCILLLISSYSLIAQPTNVTGVYVGKYTCGDTTYTSQLHIIHNSTNSLDVIVSSYIGSLRTSKIGMKANFQGFDKDIILSSPRMNDNIIIRIPKNKKKIKARFDNYSDRCTSYVLKRDSRTTKQLTSKLKKQQKLMKSSLANFDFSKINGFWVKKQESRAGDNFRLIVENNKALFWIIGDKGERISLKAESFIPKFENSEGGGITFRLENPKNKELRFDRVRFTINPSVYRYFNDRHKMGVLQAFVRTLEGEWKYFGIFKRPIPLKYRTSLINLGAFQYKDWQSNKQSSSKNVVNSSKKLRETMSKLNKEGNWRCLEQKTVYIYPNYVSTVSWKENHTNRAYIIYSPESNSELIFSASSPNPRATVQYFDNFPVIHSGRQFNSPFSTVIKLSRKTTLNATNSDSTKPIKVMIFRLFGSSPGDYGQTNCSI